MTEYICQADGCSEKQEIDRKDRAVEKGWRFDIFQIQGTLYMYALCGEHKEDHDIPDFQDIYDFHSTEEVNKMKKELTEIKTKNATDSFVMDSSGGKSRSLDQY
jgi:hypothetical protein